MLVSNPRCSVVVAVAIAALLAVPVASAAEEAVAPASPEPEWYAVEIDGTLCGFSEVTVSDAILDGRPTRVVDQTLEAHYTALGMKVDTDMDIVFHVDPETDRYRYQKVHVVQGPVEIEWSVTIEDGVARVFSSLTGAETTVELPPDVVLGHPLAAPHLVRDFGRGDLEQATYPILDIREAAIHPTRFTRVGAETVDLAGRTYDTVILDQVDEVNGVRIKSWIEPGTGKAVKVELPNGRRVFLTDATIKNRLKVANLDPGLLVPAGVQIADVPGIASMKVRAVLEPTGSILSAADLNVPGQSFEGTVEGNRIDGVFTIEHPRYDGAGAPAFPTSYAADPDLAPYLEPGDLVESDDPVLIAHARELTAGATDAWDAATRITRWVADHIDYAIPGGGTARRTFDLRAGECGAHSNLVAALSRAVGIPARVVWGCMYVPNQGGQFGQHGWNELYMGDAGWIPIDATAYEADFVDSGHIRIGEHTSLSTALNPIEAEVIEYTLTSGATQPPGGPSAAERFADYLGTYAMPQMPDKITVDVRNEALVIDIPNKVVLAMNEPDERGRWVCTMTDRLYVTFDRDEAGGVSAMTIHELVRMQRKADPETVAEDVPDDLRPLLGTYTLAAVGADFKVVFHDGKLAVDDPLAQRIVHLGEPDEDGARLDEFGKNRLSFVRDVGGAVTAFVIDAASRFARE